jgi:uncharacterized protein YjbI with pentapeptide repeats
MQRSAIVERRWNGAAIAVGAAASTSGGMERALLPPRGMENPWPIDVLAIGAAAGAAVAWQSRGFLGLTIIAKATVALRATGVASIIAPEPIVRVDEHFDGSPLRSIERASDLALYLPAADVTLVGDACAPHGAPVHAMTVRLGVFRDRTALLDKTLRVVGEGGAPERAPRPFARAPLVYERAARSAENPVGTPSPTVIDPASPATPGCFAPISRFWRQRQELLPRADRSRFDGPLPEVAPESPWTYFHAAPKDQRIGYLGGDEWILMEGVHPSVARVACRLPGVRAQGRLVIAARERTTTDLAFVADTLTIDAVRMIASVVWRARIQLPAGVTFEEVTAQVGVDLPGASIAWPSATDAPAPPAAPPSRAEPGAPEPPPASAGTPDFAATMTLDGLVQSALSARPAMPFQRTPEVPRSRPSPPPLGWQEMRNPRPPPPAEGARRGPPRRSPAIPIVKPSSLSAATLPWQLLPPQDSLTVIVKGTFDIANGGPARLRKESEPVAGDVYADDDDTKSLVYASDFAVVKAKVDVTCVGSAYAESGRGVASHVEFAFGKLRRRAAVFGDRRWNTRLGVRTAPTEPEPFASIPLTYERAFGGPSHDANPVGLGRDGGLLPNVEDPDRLIRSPSDAPAPACFGPIPITWPERAKKLGTYGGSYREKRWPYFAEDFDRAYFQAAPASQRLERAAGDESFTIVGMDPEHTRIDGRLPGVRPRCFVERTEAAGGGFEELKLELDTVAFDMNEGKVNLVWRGLVEVSEEEAPEINALFVTIDDALTLEAARDAYLARVWPKKPVLQTPATTRPANDVATPAPEAAATEEPEIPGAGEAPPLLPPPSPEALEATLRSAGMSDDEIAATLGGPGPAQEPEHEAAAKPRRDAELGLRGDVIAALAAGESLEGRDLAGADLSGLDFCGRSLVGAKLEGADLSGARAAGADFSGVSAARARFVEADLAGARFDGASLVGADFTRAKMGKASLRKCTLDSVRLYDADAAGATFDESSLLRARAEGVVLDGASLRDVAADGSIWEGASLEGAIFAKARLVGASFARAKGANANFAAADVKEGRFRRAALPHAIFLRANLMMATFERARLDGADLRGANLHAAETWHASLDDAKLDLAILTLTKLAGAT